MVRKLDLKNIQDRVAGESEPGQNATEYQQTPDYLERRIETQNEVVKGKRVRRTLYSIDPETCMIRDDHDRIYDNLNAENCEDLIEGIKVHGQEIPAIVRRIEHSKYQYELISGARRHWTTTYLGKELIVEIRELNEEDIFLLSDEENRNRQDITDYERAIKYERALGSHYKNQSQMALRMGVRKDWLSRYLDLAKMPAEIVSAYKDVSEIKVRHARDLKPLLKDTRTKAKILKAAIDLAANPQPANKLLAIFKAAAVAEAKKLPLKKEVLFKNAANKQSIVLQKDKHGNISISITQDTGLSKKEWNTVSNDIWSFLNKNKTTE